MSSPVDEVKKTNLECTNALGQLIRVNDPHENATWVYSYDRGGNILSKAKYAYTTGALGAAVETIPYTYGDANWKDKLTAYNGTAITYDAIGNPLNDGAWAFTWAAGRQLKKMVREDRTLDFKYDHNGMRIQKVLQHDWYPETTNYTYHGKLLTHMTVDYHDWDEAAQQDKLHFFYDAQSRPMKISYNGVIYTYVHNLQGDIIGILDSTGALVVEYKYDAWGKLLGTTGTLADTLGKRNPFRYRGYVYDEETGLYYLVNRYYEPDESRFISSDRILGLAGRLCEHNVYMYCRNKPANCLDALGLATVYVNVYLRGILDYGHVDISVDSFTVSYGRYGEVDEETGGLTGEGILVIDNYGKSYYEALAKGRSIFRFELEMGEEEVNKLVEFYANQMNDENHWKTTTNSKGQAKYYKVQDYHIQTSNCTTMVMNALKYAYGKEKFPYGEGLWIPHLTLLTFLNLYDSGVGIVKNVISTIKN